MTAQYYSWFHIIFAMASMYVAMLLVDQKILRTTPDSEAGDEPDYDIYIGQSEMATWMRVVSSWICIVLHRWRLLAPLAMPDRFGDRECREHQLAVRLMWLLFAIDALRCILLQSKNCRSCTRYPALRFEEVTLASTHRPGQ